GAASLPLVAGEAGEPDFSPDGTRIVFAHGRHEIGIVSVAGGTPTYVTVPPPEPGTTIYSVQSPIWSPDGSAIALGDIGAKAGLERYSQGGVFLMRPDGTGLSQIESGAAVPTGWQPLPRPAAAA